MTLLEPPSLERPPSAIGRMHQVYVRAGASRPFGHDLALMLDHGVVVSMPEVFLMCRPVRRDAPEEQMNDFRIAFQNPDCWHVWGAAVSGTRTLADVLALMPWHLPWICFRRVKPGAKAGGRAPRLKFYRTERLLELAGSDGASLQFEI